IYAMVVHLVPMLRWAGQTAATAALTAALIGVSALPGRLVLNTLGDRLPRASILSALLLVMGLSVAVLTVLHRGGFIFGFAVIYGLGNGCFSPLKATIMADYFAGARFGTILSTQSAIVTLATATGPALVGTLYDRTGGYQSGLALIAFCLFLAGAIVLLTPRLTVRS
ncbi:MAG: MFS transporter, partial [Dehalococcoidia bacterium]